MGTVVDVTNDSSENDSYNGYSVDADDQPQEAADSLVDAGGLDDPLDDGNSPPDGWSVAEGFGNTPYEESLGESLDRRLAQEILEPDPYDEAESVGLDRAGVSAEEAAMHVIDEDDTE